MLIPGTSLNSQLKFLLEFTFFKKRSLTEKDIIDFYEKLKLQKIRATGFILDSGIKDHNINKLTEEQSKKQASALKKIRDFCRQEKLLFFLKGSFLLAAGLEADGIIHKKKKNFNLVLDSTRFLYGLQIKDFSENINSENIDFYLLKDGLLKDANLFPKGNAKEISQKILKNLNHSLIVLNSHLKEPVNPGVSIKIKQSQDMGHFLGLLSDPKDSNRGIQNFFFKNFSQDEDTSLSELEWISFLKKQTKKELMSSLPGFIGIGDDCAFIPKNDQALQISSDTQWEGVHFRRDWSDPYDIGFKGVTATYSDLACKGVRGAKLMLTSAFPSGMEKTYAKEIYRGIDDACRLYDLELIGGNTVFSKNAPLYKSTSNRHNPGPLMLDFFILGFDNIMPLRKNAREGDVIVLLGYPGLAYAGYLLFSDRSKKENTKQFQKLRQAFLRPEIDNNIAKFIQKFKREEKIFCSIDISDGLLGDMRHILKASDKSASIQIHTIPLFNELKDFAKQHHKDPLKLALQGGEDYFPLITVAKKNINDLQKQAIDCNIPFFPIGEILGDKYTPENAIRDLPDQYLSLTGYEHL